MRRLLSYLPKKHLGAWLVAALALVLPLATYAAWGPDRPTYTYDGPGTPGADHVVFNSFVNNPHYGDERTFFDGKEASNTNEGGFQDGLNVDGHDELTLRVYVHNNADPSLNDSGEGIAKNTKVRVNLPEANGVNLRAIAHISADNADPEVVTDTLDFDSQESPFQLEYVEGSAKIRTNAGTFGLSDSIVTEGAQIGHDQMNGDVPGCFEYDGIVTMKVKVKQADLNVTKQVKVNGSDQEYQARNTANVGDTLNYRIEFKNTGDTQLKSVNIGDNLPAFVDYVPNSTYVANDSTDFSPVKLDSNNLTKGSIDIGNYNTGANAFVYFQATINDSLNDECGVATLRNVVLAKPEGMNNWQNAAITTVDTGNDCEEQPEEPVAECVQLTAEPAIINVGETVNLEATAKAENGATVESYSFNYGDGNTDTVGGNTTSHTYTDDGTYTATVDVNFMVDGEQVSKSGQNCKVVITVEKEPVQPTYSCEKLSVDNAAPQLNEEVTFTAKANAANGASVKQYRFDFGDGSEVLVTDNADVTHSYNTADQYDASVEVVFDVNGEMKTVSSADCAVSVDVQPEAPETPESPETPETPEKIVNTGAGEALMAITGTGAMGQAITSYVKSRKGLRGVLKD